MRLVDVALPVPLYRTFSYAVDGAATEALVPGARVVVPFRTGRDVGVCVAVDVPAEAGRRYKSLLEVPDAEPALTAPLLATCRWMANHYAAPVGLTLRSALPALLASASASTPAPRTQRVAIKTRDLPSLLERDRIFSRAKKQRELFELLESLGDVAPVPLLLERLGCSTSVLDGLVKRELVRVEEEAVARDPFTRRPAMPPPSFAPTAAQRAAIDAVARGAPGEVFLLHGVTGSGKTLVYIEVLRRVVEQQGRAAIVLVPEIALTPQTVDRFRSVFGDRVAVLHSALSDGERLDAWRALRRGEKRIAVGARSAIFAPLENVGAVIVDEEQEASYKQGETPRYHARDVAIVRAKHEGAVVVLGTATPSLESWSAAQRGAYRLLSLPERVGGGALPVVRVVDLRAPPPSAAGTRDPFRRVISEPLELALDARLARGEQSLLLLNRRGHASFLQCSSCGNVAVCPNCSVSLTYHRTPERLLCHHCMHTGQPSLGCPACGAERVRQRGLGTQQVERVLQERFPTARIVRMDVDSTGAKWAHTEILDRVGRGEIDILIGTQMIAKGLDFPNVTLVGVVDADVGINLPDFRASERCFQLLAQVAGRAGRGPKGGEVFIQTRCPDHHAVRFAVRHDFLGFVAEELGARESPPYPPTTRLVNVIVSGDDEIATERAAQDAASWMRRLARQQPDTPFAVVGPAPCPIERIKGRWRWHFLVRAKSAPSLTRVAAYFARRYQASREVRVTIDRDPVAML